MSAEYRASRAERPWTPMGVVDGEPFGASLRRSDVLREGGVNGALLAAALDAEGALLVSGCETVDFIALTDAVGTGFVVHGSRLKDATGVDPTIQTVDRGNHAIALHCELAILPERPTLVCLCGKRPADVGGATMLADGARLVRALPDRARRQLMERRLRFVHRIGMDMWRPFQRSRGEQPMRLREGESFDSRVEEVGGEEVLTAEYLTPGVFRARPGGPLVFASSVLSSLDPTNYMAVTTYRLTFEGGAPIPDALVDDVRAAADRVTLDVRLDAGDVLLADNLRVLHGRRAFEGERVIWSRFGYHGGEAPAGGRRASP